MMFVVRLLVVAALCLTAFPAPASAQYMFLDSNGDGANTAADQLNANGTATTVDVWLRTNTNRDLSAASCVSADGELTINSYVVNLQASGGTVSYAGYVNQQTGMTTVTVPLTPLSNTTQFSVGRGSGAILAPGDYKLCTVNITGASGSPSVAIIALSALQPTDVTNFGSLCSGNSFDNTMKLGDEWSDVDGLAAAPGGNLDPIITAPATAAGTENSAFSVTASATDPEAANVTLSQTNNAPFLAGPASASPALNPSITLFGTPNFAQAGSYAVNWSAADATTGTASATTAITIANLNRNPVITAPATVSGAETSPVSVTASASDPDADNVGLSQTNNAPFLTGPTSAGPSANPSLTLSGTPSFTHAGSYTINWSASVGGTATATTAITIANTDRPVALAPIGGIAAVEGFSASTAVSASDPDGETITLTPTLPAFAVLNAPTSGAGSVSTTVTASPVAGGAAGSPYSASITATAGLSSDTEIFSITVASGNRPPVLAGIGNKSIAEGASTDYPVSATDPDGDLITISATLPPFGALNAPTTGTGSVTTSFNLAPGFSAAGSYSGSVTATANSLTDSETFSIEVANTNRPPAMPAIAPITVAEGASASTPVSATDADGDLLTLSVISLPTFAVLNPPLTGSGSVTTSITATPGFNDAGSHSGSIRVTDPSNANVTSGVSITVTNTDRGPSLDPIANVIVGQGGSASRNVNASDPDGNVVEVSASLPAFAVLNAPRSGTGSVATTISIDPTVSTTTGDYAASVTATALALIDTKSFTITVTRTNQVIQLDPIADVTLDEGFSSSVTVNATDADNDLITVTASLPGFAALLAPTSGTGTVTTAVTINPGFADAGVYASSVTATDGIQPVTEPFQITVNNVDRPVALAPIADLNVAEGASASRSVSASDPDSDPITLGSSLPAFASLTDNGNGTGSVTAAPGFTDSGSYPSSITATANGTTDTENFTIVVSDFDRAPVLAAISTINVQEGSSANTPVSATDADGETIGLTASLPAFATLDAPISGAGTVSTTVTASPAAGDAGSYPSSVTATANFLTDTKNFTINVTRPNQTPTISAPATETVDEGQNLNFTVTAADGDSDPLSLTASGVPAGASFLDNGNGTGTFDWTPGFNQAGSYTATFNVSDGRGGANSASTGITVSNVNRCPTANDGGPYSGVVNVAVSFNGSASSDPDGDVLSYTWTFGDGANGTGATVSHTYVTGGVFNVNLAVGDGFCEDNAPTTATIVTDFPAHVFTTGGNNTTSLGAGKPTTCVQIEPIAGSFAISDVDLTTIKMISVGTGSVSEILAIFGKTAVDGDKDRNGTTEIRACFTKADLRLLFSGLPAGRRSVTVTIEGNLTTGGKFRGLLVHTVKSTGGALAATVSPNPLNPETALSFQLRTPGRVTVKIFDLNGRLVKTLVDDTRGAGYQDLTWNGTADSGVKVASGVYYFRLDTPDGRIVKAATVLK